MNARTTFPLDARVIVALFIASLLALWLAPATSAQSVIMAGSTSKITVNPGDTIEAGYEVAIAKAPHPADTVSVTNAVVRVSVNCPNGSSQTLNINLASQSVLVPADSNDWSPGGSVYQGRARAPSNLCGGQQGSTNGATFMATFGHECHQGNKDCCHEHCFRFHVRCYHNGNDHEGEMSDRHCEGKEDRECESPEKREHRECCKEKDD
jgi:hypothetical protein